MAFEKLYEPTKTTRACYAPSKAYPLDYRSVVSTVEDLDQIPNSYEGMVVVVTRDPNKKGIYYKDASGNWRGPIILS